MHRRAPVLSDKNELALAGVRIAPIKSAARFSIRLNGTPSTPFNIPINTCIARDNWTLARLGPDEWLLFGVEYYDDWIAELRGKLSGRFFSWVDISHRDAAIAIHGPYAPEILNGGCPLDLREEHFPVGSATRTVLWKAEIVLLRPDTTPYYRIETWRSFAPYIYGLLQRAVRDISIP